MMRINYKQLNRILGALLGGCIGDALGLPAEVMTREEILQATGGKGITGFMPTITAPRVRKPFFIAQAGTPSDDWQLTRAVAEAFIAAGGFDLEEIARRHVVAAKQTTQGWGRATKKSVVELDKYFSSGGQYGRRWDLPAAADRPGQGAGNGVAMKVMPLAIWRAVLGQSFPLWEEIKTLGQLTHSDIRASIAACAVAVIAGNRLAGSDINAAESITEEFAELFVTISKVERSVSPLIRQDDAAYDASFSGRLQLAYHQANDLAALQTKVGTNCFCIESVPFAIAVYYRHPTDFRAAVLEAVNSGGDTDTTAAIVGGLVGATVGVNGIPRQWRDELPDTDQVLAIGKQLAAAAVNARRS